MSYRLTRLSQTAAIVAAGLLVVSSSAVAAPTLDLTVTNTVTGNSQVFSGSSLSSDTSELNANGVLGGYDYSVGVTATDEDAVDELFEVNINTTTTATNNDRLQFDLVASGFTGFTGSTPAKSVVTPSSVVEDLDVETFVDGIQVLNAQNIPEGGDVSDTQQVSLGSPYSIRHLSAVEHDIDDTTTFDTTTTVVPVPATVMFLGIGLFGLGLAARRHDQTG